MKASVFMGASVDGFIARANGALDWLPHDAEDHGYEAFFASVDALLFGRHTYDTVLGFGAWPYGTKPVYVLSSNPLAPPRPGAAVRHLSGDPEDVFRQLQSDGVTHVYVDGGVTVQRFLRAGLIHRLIVTRIPVLLGSGIPLFGPTDADIPLRHVGTRTYPSGLVQTEYEVVTRRAGLIAPLPPEHRMKHDGLATAACESRGRPAVGPSACATAPRAAQDYFIASTCSTN